MKKIFSLLILISSINVFAEEYDCVFNKWFDEVIEKPSFAKFQRDDDNFLYNGRMFSIMFENKERLTLINSKSRFDITTIIINKETKKLTSSLTQDNLVIVLKGYCN